MQKYIIFIFLIICIGAIIVAGCTIQQNSNVARSNAVGSNVVSSDVSESSVAGNYVNIADSNDYIELDSDGTLVDHPSGTTAIYYGKYEIDGNHIRVFSDDGSPTNEYQFVNNSIVIDRGPTPSYLGSRFATYKKQ
jgi:hypothetical protein